MRNMRIRSLMLYLIVCAFFAGTIFFCYEFTTEGKSWVFSNINRHLSQGTASQGKISDRNGLVLAGVTDGKRTYCEDKSVRTALLHTVGDGSILIPSSIQSHYASELFGYNAVTGLGAPEVISMSKNISLTLDGSICAKVSSDFKGKKGAAVAYNYLTGEVLCMVSLPTYDVLERPSAEDLKSEKYEGVYLNRVLNSSYTPGSVFKIFTTAAALDLMPDAEKRNFSCEKVKVVDGEKVTCMKSHGKLSLKEALSKSCDIAFCDIALELGKDAMTKKMNEMGFNKSLYFDNLEISKSVYNVESATRGDLGWSGIGQYTNTLNPMHMVKIMGALANSGVCTEPYIVKSMSFGQDDKEVNLDPPKITSFFKPSTADKIKEMMRYTVKSNYGESKFPNMCAKTGTAEIGEGKTPHGWMVGFSYDKSFPVAFAVVVENGDFGIKSAGPIVSNMIKYLHKSFQNK